MASRLEDAYRNLKLIEEEAEVVVFDDEGAMKAVLHNIWQLEKVVVIRDLDDNLFSFQFFASADKEFALNEGPWAFDGKILLLKEITGMEVPSELGTFVGCEVVTMFGVDQSLCFKVDIDVTKPLRRVVNVKGAKGLVWVKIKYVKLPDFCDDCGMLGHVLNGCDVVDSDTAEENLQYGDWLWASPLKLRRRNADAEIKEEAKLFLAFWKNRDGCQARQRLPFGDGRMPTPALVAVHSHQGADDGSNNMIVDEHMALVLGNEASKRKLDDIAPPKRAPQGAMSILWFNCRGLGATQAVSDLRGLLRRLAPKVVFLSETKRSKLEIDSLLSGLSDFFGVFVDARGRAGGLTLLWDKKVDVTLLSYSSNHIESTVRWEGEDTVWHFSGIYGWPESHLKWKTGQLITELKSHSNLSRLVGGDLTDEAVERLMERVETCAGELSRWNRKAFGLVGTEIHKLEAKLQCQRDAVSRREILGQIREWRRREEILWWQWRAPTT
ncbi:hypothetical protein Cgig2_024802 [Carnegiea gigantea]|uniref:DUF4283 domain-containing protein n=1 Tax=Carnegiea gigantea TaxID=171969 RepID=A0A9Q1JP74_9CARY|nr:hypothetical protein Cgig2_024802 [Carnegiea gigantea]